MRAVHIIPGHVIWIVLETELLPIPAIVPTVLAVFCECHLFYSSNPFYTRITVLQDNIRLLSVCEVKVGVGVGVDLG